jgi:Response regulators consisting of a CheY-like receiver domain and a winged-helix DNA-binding domain
MYKVLIIEDEYHIRHIVHEYFAMKNIEIVEASNGYEALELMNDDIDLVLLDIMMPGIDGYEVCKQLRMKSSQPIIFISALLEEQNQLMAYDLGGDDYITKPFKPSVLYAKCLAMIKRDKKVEDDIMTFGNIQLDKMNHLLIIDENSQFLANKEYELLLYFCECEGRLLPREQILNHVWGYDYFGDGRALDTYVKKLRKKLGKYSNYIQTVIKTGYMFKVVNHDEKEK